MPAFSGSRIWADWRGRLPYRRYLDVEDRARRLRAQGFSLLALASGAVYLGWLWPAPGDQASLISWLFFGLETGAYLLLIVLTVNVWQPRYHRPEGLPIVGRPPVDVFIPCCGEPLAFIGTTLRAAARLDYAPLAVYVLDDGGSPEVEALARCLGLNYLSRVREGLPRTDAKSGNLNFGLSRSQGEFILVLDADQVPQPEIISRLLGLCQLPQVALVQSRQQFLVPDGDPFYNRDAVFYEAVQPCNDRVNAAVSCGSGVIYRRQALVELGGFVTWNLVEDLTTSYELVSRGWKTLYYPHVLAQGLAPETLPGVLQQRFQWCLDAMRLFFWDNPLAKKGMRLEQRLHFLIIMLAYILSGLLLPLFYLCPLYCYLTGATFLSRPEWQYFFLRLLYLGLTILAFHYLFFQKAPLKQFKILCGMFPVYAWATLAALVYPPGRKPNYKVNLPNGVVFPTLFFLTPLLLLICLHLLLPFLSLSYGWAAPRLIVTNAIFSAFIIWVLGEMLVLAVSKPRWLANPHPNLIYRFEG